jgi:glycine betaine/proline transport system permease protein
MITRSSALNLPLIALRRLLRVIVLGGLALIVLLLIVHWPEAGRDFPVAWNVGLREQIDAMQRWLISNRANHPLFVYGFTPFSAVVDTTLRQIEAILLGLGWPVVLLIAGGLGYLAGGWWRGLFCSASMLLIGLFGLWQATLQTLALMLVVLLLAVLIGVPIGIAAAFSARLDRVLRPLLDAMQTVPAFVYLVPVLLLFGVARVPAVVATLIYALPPLIRLTNLGIRQANLHAVEAARAFGATPGQILYGVQLPLALPSILMGINQTIMMAFGMVVIAAMIGAGGLGREVLVALQRLNVGQALEAGISIVLLAMLLDRLSAALARVDVTAWMQEREPSHHRIWPLHLLADRLPAPLAAKLSVAARPLGVALVIGSVLLLDLLFLRFGIFPSTWRLSMREPTNALVAWARDNLFFITGPLSDGITLYLLNPSRALLLERVPWPAVIVSIAALGYAAGGWRLAWGTAAGLLLIGLIGMWAPAMETLSQVVLMVLITLLIAVPIGVLAAQSTRLSGVLRPLLDALQTIPAFVYLVPVIMLFNVGRVPGLIAAVLYALPPGIRLTELGLRLVPSSTIEAARAFGSTRAQIIAKVQIPQALPSIMLAVNQVIVMVLAMVIIAGLVGGAGLGIEAVRGLARNETGRGIEAGLAILILAVILDRITQAAVKATSPADAQG